MKEQNAPSIGKRWYPVLAYLVGIIILVVVVIMVGKAFHKQAKTDQQPQAANGTEQPATVSQPNPTVSESANTTVPNVVATNTVTFPQEGCIKEAESMQKSTDSVFWLNSGWKTCFSGGVTSTDADVFRIMTKKAFTSSIQTVYFQVTDVVNSDSPNRQAYNIVGLYSRYVNEKNSYYVGVGVDGNLRIKKKINGKDIDLLDPQKKIFPGRYDRYDNPLLLPDHTWLGLKTETINLPDGSVKINVFMDWGYGNWAPAASAIDRNNVFLRGNGGTLSDYLKVQLKDYSIR